MRREIGLLEFRKKRTAIERQELLSFAGVPEEFRGESDPSRWNFVAWLGRTHQRIGLDGIFGEIDLICGGSGGIPNDLRTIFIYGPVGTGKTKLAVEAMVKISAGGFLRPGYFLAASVLKPWSSNIIDVGIAVLDDYLRFYDWRSQQAQAIDGVIAERYHRGWPTIITTNIDPSKDLMDEAVKDRIGTGILVRMKGKSKRRKEVEDVKP